MVKYKYVKAEITKRQKIRKVIKMFSMSKKSIARIASFNSNIKATCAALVCSSEDSMFNHEDTCAREADIS